MGNTKTLVIYQYPAAERDLREWSKLMLDSGRLVKMDWDNGPSFEIHHPNPDYDELDPRSPGFFLEIVICVPMNNLFLENNPKKYDKVVIYGAIDEYADEIISFLQKRDN